MAFYIKVIAFNVAGGYFCIRVSIYRDPHKKHKTYFLYDKTQISIQICARFLYDYIYEDMHKIFMTFALCRQSMVFVKKVIQILQIQCHTNLAPMQTIVVNVFAYSVWWRAQFARTLFRPIYSKYTSRNFLNCFTKTKQKHIVSRE